MTPSPHRRLLAIVGLLLTPLVAWAASFFGGWLGALAAGRISGDRAAIGLMVGGAVVGSILGTVAWIKLLLRYRLPLEKEPDPPAASSQGGGAQPTVV